MPAKTFRLGLALVIAVELTLTWIHPSADPPLGYSTDLSLSTDGYWYLSEAKSWSQGTESKTHADYRQPLFSLPSGAIFSIFGVSLASSRVLGSLASLGCIFLLAYAVRKRYGPELALCAAAVLAIHPAWHALVRSAVIYPWVSFWFLLILTLGASRRASLWWTACGLTLLVALTLKTIVLLAAPALCFEGARRYAPRLGWKKLAVALSVPLAAIPLSVFVLPEFWSRVRWYVMGIDGSTAGLWERVFEFETRSHLFSSAPVLLVFYALGLGLFSSFLSPTRGGSRRLERMMHLTFGGTFVLFSFCGYTPLRYLMMFFPGLIYVAAGALNGLLEWERRRPLCRHGALLSLGRITWISSSVLLAVHLSIAARGGNLPATGTATVASLVLIVVMMLGLRFGKLRGRLAISVLILGSLIPAAPRLIDMIVYPSYSLQTANRQLTSLVPEDAALFGPYSHALTTENDLAAEQISDMRYGKGLLEKLVKDRAWSHLVCSQPTGANFQAIFAANGVPLEIIDTFYVRGLRIGLYRLGTAPIAASEFELGKQQLAAGELDLAARSFRNILARHPRSAPAWEALGEAEARGGHMELAFRAFSEAVKIDPYRPSAHLGIAQIFAGGGYIEESLLELERARSIAPTDAGLRDHVDRLAANVRNP